MRILVIAYEFPPIIAAQSLRWFYLTEELARLGVEVHVLCPEFSALEAFPFAFNNKVTVHRTWPGPYVALSQSLAKKIDRSSSKWATDVIQGPSLPQKIYQSIRKFLDNLLFPDLRTEWYFFAKKSLRSLLNSYQFDALISSYEPGVDLLLGLWAQKKYGVKWIVDLGDPILAPYTPRWRRKIDSWFEKRVLERAERIVLTTDQIRPLLCKRHHLTNPSKFVCIPQGFPHHRFSTVRTDFALPRGIMNIVFTGTFYRDFRSPTNFASALRALKTNKIMTTLIGDNFEFISMFEGINNIKFIGKISHFECLAIQNKADLLLNIGNIQDYQVPGKIYEYIGARKPILHIKTGMHDPGADLIEQLHAGLVVFNDPEKIGAALLSLVECWQDCQLSTLYSADPGIVDHHSWAVRANSFQNLLVALS
ncbi:MAG: glycosyltransferase [Candidatus Competibacter sp.]|nr:glycosyltransferase [Candidatus Competibacter sp.]